MTKTNSYTTGLWAEFWAAWFLRLKGYRILIKRYKTPQGEVDLIVKKGKTVVFVEVKRRQTLADGLYAIDRRTQKRITAASMLYLRRNPQYINMDIRFDAVVLASGHWPAHILGAWTL